MLKFQVILVMIFLGALLTGFFFWIKISQYPKMPPLSKLCLEGISVEVCHSGDYLVGRENMKKDGDIYTVYDQNGTFLYSEGGKGVERKENPLYTFRIKTTNTKSCFEELLSSSSPIKSACQ